MNAIRALGSIAAILPVTTVGAGDQRPVADLRFLAQLEPGQRLQATVQASLSSTKFAVMLSPDSENASAGQTVHMKLPPGVKPGDHLNLVFIGREPRPHFALVTDLSPRADVSRLSETSRFIDDLLRDPSYACRLPASNAVSLLPQPPDDPAELSLRLALALERSGFFYESHQKQWIAGTRTFAELLLEPQARLTRPGSRVHEPGVTGDPAPTTFVASRTGGIVPAEDGICQSSAQGAPVPVSDPVHREVLALVRQQLDVLETRHITWQGEAWPGQIVSLEILEEEKGAYGQTGESDEASILPWKTCLRLTLPNLGTVTANLRLHVCGLELRLAAHDSSAGDTLRSGMAVLGRALESSGITLLSVSVDVDEEGYEEG
jgi:hypothetical protein